MDKVKLGRALGYGARHAMKTLASAADAVTSPDPRPAKTKFPSASRVSPAADRQAVQASAVADSVRQVYTAKRQVKAQAVTHVKRSLWAPLKSFSSVLWLQVTGTFFALFALTMGGAVIRHLQYFSLPIASEDGRKIYFYLLAFVVFGYYTLSNFIRASRRQSRQRR